MVVPILVFRKNNHVRYPNLCVRYPNLCVLYKQQAHLQPVRYLQNVDIVSLS